MLAANDAPNGVNVQIHRGPLTRQLILSGPSNDFQQAEAARLLSQIPGVHDATWTRSAGIPLIVDIMNTSTQIELQAAAAKSLGQLGGTHGDASVVSPLLAKLEDPKTDWSVLTEVAWSLGKIPDKRSIQPLYNLDKKLQAMRDPENVPLKKLKEAVFWSIKQCDTWDQYS